MNNITASVKITYQNQVYVVDVHEMNDGGGDIWKYVTLDLNGNPTGRTSSDRVARYNVDFARLVFAALADLKKQEQEKLAAVVSCSSKKRFTRIIE